MYANSINRLCEADPSSGPRALLAAALSGLMAGAACAPIDDQAADPADTGAGSVLDCGSTPTPDAGVAADTGVPLDTSGDDASSDSGGHGGTGTGVVTSTEIILDLSYEALRERCDQLGGYMQTHAACAGVNSCRGLSYNKWSFVLTEHTCRATNSCGGMSCVALPEDHGAEGAAIYADSCAGCHGGETFTLFVPENTNTEVALDSFDNRADESLEFAVAFGRYGINALGVAEANMPAFHTRLSRSEVERVIDHVRAMPKSADTFPVQGGPRSR